METIISGIYDSTRLSDIAAKIRNIQHPEHDLNRALGLANQTGASIKRYFATMNLQNASTPGSDSSVPICLDIESNSMDNKIDRNRDSRSTPKVNGSNAGTRQYEQRMDRAPRQNSTAPEIIWNIVKRYRITNIQEATPMTQLANAVQAASDSMSPAILNRKGGRGEIDYTEGRLSTRANEVTMRLVSDIVYEQDKYNPTLPLIDSSISPMIDPIQAFNTAFTLADEEELSTNFPPVQSNHRKFNGPESWVATDNPAVAIQGSFGQSSTHPFANTSRNLPVHFYLPSQSLEYLTMDQSHRSNQQRSLNAMSSANVLLNPPIGPKRPTMAEVPIAAGQGLQDQGRMPSLNHVPFFNNPTQHIDDQQTNKLSALTTLPSPTKNSPENVSTGRVVNINVNRPMIEHFHVNAASPTDVLSEFRSKVEQVLLDILDSANAIN